MGDRANPSAKKSGKYGRLLQNTFILTVGTFISKMLVFLLLPLYTEYLSTSEYGTADLISNLANFLIPIFCCGLSEGVLRFSLRETTSEGTPRYDRRSVFSTATVITALGCLLAFLLLPLFCGIEEIGNYGLLVVLYVVSANLHSIASEYVRACEKTALYAIQGILNTAFVIGLNLILLLGFDAGIFGYVFSVIGANFLTTLFLTVVARLDRAFSFGSIRRDTARALLRFSLPLVPGLLLWWVISVSDRYVLTWITGAEANGLYVAAAKIPTLLTLLTTVFLTAWKTSAVTEDSGESEAARGEKASFFGNVYHGFVALMFCAGAGITLFSRIFAQILFSDEFFPAWQFIPVLTVGTVFYSLSRFLGSVYFVKEKSIRSTVTAAIAAGINILLNFLLIPSYGAFGAAIATLASYLVEFLIRQVDATREIRFSANYLTILLYSVFLGAEVYVVTAELPYWEITAVLLTLCILGLSGKTLYRMGKGLIKTILRCS